MVYLRWFELVQLRNLRKACFICAALLLFVDTGAAVPSVRGAKDVLRGSARAPRISMWKQWRRRLDEEASREKTSEPLTFNPSGLGLGPQIGPNTGLGPQISSKLVPGGMSFVNQGDKCRYDGDKVQGHVCREGLECINKVDGSGADHANETWGVCQVRPTNPERVPPLAAEPLENNNTNRTRKGNRLKVAEVPPKELPETSQKVVDHCSGNPMLKTIKTNSSGCFRACSGICEPLAMAFQTLNGDNGIPSAVVVCQHRAVFSCMIEGSNVKSCAAVLAKAESMSGITISHDARDLDRQCQTAFGQGTDSAASEPGGAENPRNGATQRAEPTHKCGKVPAGGHVKIVLAGKQDTDKLQFEEGAVVTVNCATEYMGTGGWNLTCHSDGTWKGLEDVECRPNQCDIPFDPLGAWETQENEDGHFLRLECVEGYRPSGGKSIVKCTDTAIRSAPDGLPVCAATGAHAGRWRENLKSAAVLALVGIATPVAVFVALCMRDMSPGMFGKIGRQGESTQQANPLVDRETAREEME